MFLPNSRYAKVATVDTVDADGRPVSALRLRRLMPLAGTLQAVVEGERLDLIAHRVSGDATQSWHVADANTALDARTLVATPGSTLRVPAR